MKVRVFVWLALAVWTCEALRGGMEINNEVIVEARQPDVHRDLFFEWLNDLFAQLFSWLPWFNNSNEEPDPEEEPLDTSAPTKSPTPMPTMAPTAPPSPIPTKTPTSPPTPSPTKNPSLPPTPEPTAAPTPSPVTAAPNASPTESPITAAPVTPAPVGTPPSPDVFFIDSKVSVGPSYSTEGGSWTWTTPDPVDMTNVPSYYVADMFQTLRLSDHTLTYIITGFAPLSSNKVDLGLAEMYQPNCMVGNRVMDITVNGAPFLSNYDTFAKAGCKTAVIESGTFPASNLGEYRITFSAIVENMMISAIRIEPSGVPPTTPAPVTVTPAPVTPAPVTVTPAPVTPAPVMVTPAPVTPAPVTPAPVMVTPAPVTPAPVTPAPVTPAPVTVTPAPVTPAPVTPAPVTVTPAPVTPAPVMVTPAPVTPAPVTPAPVMVTPAPVTPAPVTPAPVTPAPVTVTPAPVTPAPVTPAPVTPAPVTPAPVMVTPAPITPAPVTPAPVTPAPVTPAPVTPAPVMVTPAPVMVTPAPVTPAPVTPAPVMVTPAPVTPAPVAPTPGGTISNLYINAGDSEYTDSQGNVWEQDAPYVSHLSGFSVTYLDPTSTPVTGSGGNHYIFQTERYGEFGYEIPTGVGRFKVSLFFAEVFHNAAGLRIFNVDMEGDRVHSNVDIFAEVGKHTALVKEHTLDVTDGVLNLSFLLSTDTAKVSGINILYAGPIM